MSSTTKCQSAPRVVNRRSFIGVGFAAAAFVAAKMSKGFEYHLDRKGSAISIRRRSRSDNGEWIQRIESPSPAAIALSPNGRFAYVVNAIGEYEFLPRGTVESYEITDGGSGLRLLGVTPLSLSGTFPSDIALSPDGRYAVVAIAGGRAYNVLPVKEADGVLDAPVQIVKRYGVAPERVAFARTGQTLYGSAGETFRFENGRIEI